MYDDDPRGSLAAASSAVVDRALGDSAPDPVELYQIDPFPATLNLAGWLVLPILSGKIKTGPPVVFQINSN